MATAHKSLFFSALLVLVATLAFAQDSRDLYTRVGPQVLYLRHELLVDGAKSKQTDLWKRFETAMDAPFLGTYQVMLSGSGFYVDDQGKAMTNRHVVQVGDLEPIRAQLIYGLDRTIDNLDSRFLPADRSALKTDVRVILQLGSYRFSAWAGTQFLGTVTVLATAPPKEADLALIQVEGGRGIPLALAPDVEMTGALVGKSAASFGYPLGDSMDSMFKERVVTMNKGAVSAFRGKELLDLQHTAAISGGNSGGPLVDETGRVLGVNTALIGQGQGNSLFYAVSSSAVRKFLVSKGYSSLGLWNERLAQISQETNLGLNRNQAGEWEAPRTVLLDIPSVATAALNGKPLGSGPQALVLGSGVSTLVVESGPLHQEFLLRLVPSLAAPGTLRPRLDDGLPRVQLSSEPSGANVVADGRLLGTTPLEAILPPGAYQLSLSKDGAAYRTEQLVVSEASKQTWLGSGKLASELVLQVSGLLVDAKFKFREGETSYEYRGTEKLYVPAGEYTLLAEGLPSLAGIEVPVIAGKDSTTFDLRPFQKKASFELRGMVPGAQVWVDGQQVDWPADGVGQLAMGRHSLRAAGQDLNDLVETTVNVQDSRPSFLVWKAKKGLQIQSPGLNGGGLITAGAGGASALAGLILSLDAVAIPVSTTYQDYTAWKTAAGAVLAGGVVVGAIGAGMYAASFFADSNQRMSSDDCMVLIPTRIRNPDAIPLARKFMMFVDKLPGVTVKEAPESWLEVLVRAPAKLGSITSEVTASGFRGEAFRSRLNYDLPFRPGEVIVFDFTFQQSLEKVGDRSYLTRWNFIPTENDVSARVLERFRQTDSGKAWLTPAEAK